MKCAFFHVPLDPSDPEDQPEHCEAEAAFTCCNYGGPVCEKHKCRCSKPLTPEMDAADAAVLVQLGWTRVGCSAAWTDAFEHPTGALIQRSLLGVWSGWNGRDGRRTGMTGAPSRDPLTQAARALMDEDALSVATEDDPEAAERWLRRYARIGAAAMT